MLDRFVLVEYTLGSLINVIVYGREGWALRLLEAAAFPNTSKDYVARKIADMCVSWKCIPLIDTEQGGEVLLAKVIDILGDNWPFVEVESKPKSPSPLAAAEELEFAQI